MIRLGTQAGREDYDPYGRPERSAEEELIENIEGVEATPGKILWINDGDFDSDGIPDHADGYNLNGVSPPNDPDDTSQYRQFVPIVLEPPCQVGLLGAEILLIYDESHPMEDINKETVSSQ
jgi:hypothetical protein